MTPNQTLRDALFDLAREFRGAFCLRESQSGLSGWLTLETADDLTAVATALKTLGARLSMATAMAASERGAGRVIAWHFDIDGSTVTVKLTVPEGGTVASLVPLFRNADWHEREFMELYDIAVTGRSDNRRLFLDESVSGQVMDRLIPLSVLSNAASTNMLFEKLITRREVL
ncbi:proton-conducting membrane transporter [Rhodobacter sp. TJ_12]|uniref:NADH-quinone oxidoreductase subunit C n=1 Tax=Rhodobacter sp. TJ_12 TaxID=2029399 RepID=UPI001CBE247A|nr:NADH-quinone oxidoreductase subunit C [Rhodobacter sp. TJ_12]MBZ4021532.1 proton-conducting membrane transporter [Rhodobacter sp. TJ_12]